MFTKKEINGINKRTKLILLFTEWVYKDTRTKEDFIEKLCELLADFKGLEIGR